ncbi:MAG: HD domain-containing protein [Bacteroidales bacterium]|nr:HD domain-containing protein [Bacteroidales bacterium]
MNLGNLNKKKIINDPVYGFINIPNEIIFDIIEHPYFQRLRRIKQLGLTFLVYPGAIHSRFQHALGATHLMSTAINVLRSKNKIITDEEAEAVLIAILLHDIGHGPFSHALEKHIINVDHERLSLLFMENLNSIFNGKLSLAIKIFSNNYHKKFLHQLVSSQLDMDRLDYLKRDSFFSGVTEGVISYDRIIKMLDVVDDKLVVEEKGIYSIEKFLVARRLMYWQVYMHKTVVSAELLLSKILKRARELADKKVDLFATPALKFFLYNKTKNDFLNSDAAFNFFSQLDDNDIMASIKTWSNHEDITLKNLCKNLINRHLYKIIIQNKPIDNNVINNLKNKVKQAYNVSDDELNYFIFTGVLTNNAYSAVDDRINILSKTGKLTDISEASDMLNISVLSKLVKKYYLCFPKEFEI